jgi:hypothetical protein
LTVAHRLHQIAVECIVGDEVEFVFIALRDKISEFFLKGERKRVRERERIQNFCLFLDQFACRVWTRTSEIGRYGWLE